MKRSYISNFLATSRNSERAELLTRRIFERDSRIEVLRKNFEKKRDVNEIKLCEMLRQYGWLTTDLVGVDGAAAVFYLLKNIASFEFQLELLPFITAAIVREQIPKNEDYAAFVDRLRVRIRLKQLFGTQVSATENLLVLAPLQSPERVDDWRTQYRMPPLKNYLKFLEMNYQMPLMISHQGSPPELKNVSKNTASEKPEDQNLLLDNRQKEDEIIRVDTNLVNLNVRVSDETLKIDVTALRQNDFRIFEDSQEQTATFFARTDSPFDLILLTDLSGSTTEKQGLIRKATKRFIEAARPGDRIAIVTFTDKPEIITPLTADRTKLLELIGKIRDNGRSHVWDSLNSTFSLFDKDSSKRKKAIVMMSDGVDNMLAYMTSPFPIGSKISFAELLENVRQNDVMIVPIYLNTEVDSYDLRYKKSYRQARETLAILAEESGGQMYRANKLEDLEKSYEEVLKDLRTVYSFGYTPTNENRNGSWRNIKVEVKNHPEISIRTRRGYYAK